MADQTLGTTPWRVLLPLIAALSLAGCGGSSGSSGTASVAASGATAGGSSVSGTIARQDDPSAAAGTTATTTAGVVASAVPPVTLSWTQPAKNTNGSVAADLEGYHIYYGADADSLDQVVTVEGAGNTHYTVANLASGTWYFAISAYNNSKVESRLSEVVPVDI